MSTTGTSLASERLPMAMPSNVSTISAPPSERRLRVRLSSRCLDVLGPLIESDRPQAAASIARRLNLSPRMVRTSLAACEHWLGEWDLAIRRVRGRGYSLSGTDEARRRLAKALRDHAQVVPWLSRSERRQVLLLNLFFAGGPLQLQHLQEALGVSRTTTIRVVGRAEDWLAEHGLGLVRRQNFGHLIVGDERCWREAAINLLRETCGDTWLFMIVRGTGSAVDVPAHGTLILKDLLSRICDLLSMSTMRRSVLPVEIAHGSQLSDQEYVDLFLYVALTAYRHRNGMSLLSPDELPGSAGSDRRISAARRTAKRVQARLGVQLSEAEVLGIAQRWPAAFLPEPSGSPRSILPEASESRLCELVDPVVEQASLSLHPGLRADAEFISNLHTYVARLLQAPSNGRPSGGPAQPDVEHVYPYMFSVARQCTFQLAEPLGRQPSEAEVGELAVCLVAAMERLRGAGGPRRKVLIVCNLGAVTAWLLMSRLRAEFPDVEVAGAISALEFERGEHVDDVDYIVTTIPLKAGGIPCLQVDPLLRLEDCQRLRELFEGRALERPGQGTGSALVHLSDLLTADRIRVGVSAQGWPDVVDQAAQPLVACGAVDRRFVSAMKDVILENGPYMVIWPGAVLLHARPIGVRNLCMSMVSLRTPTPFGHPDNDPVSIAIVLAAADNHKHFVALQELNAMMQDETARAEIGRTMHKAVVLHWVSRFSRISIDT